MKIKRSSGSIVSLRDRQIARLNLTLADIGVVQQIGSYPNLLATLAQEFGKDAGSITIREFIAKGKPFSEYSPNFPESLEFELDGRIFASPLEDLNFGVTFHD